jgi:aspartyl-tRNA(Asn)/glutamyl-tRNA(Gln) amidotransferase subunit C
MKLSRDEVLHIARLARVGLTESEINRLSEQLSHILESFEILQQVDTTGVPPTAQSVALQSVVRDDEVAPSFPTSDILANAPRREGDCFRVRAVLE